MFNKITDLVKETGGAIDSVFTSDDERLTKAELLMRIDSENQKAQLDYQKEELKTGNMFITGWRPLIGWFSAIGFGGLMVYYLVFKTLYPTLPDINGQVMDLLLWIIPILWGIRSGEKVLTTVGMKGKK